jgi:hypothetical protein
MQHELADLVQLGLQAKQAQWSLLDQTSPIAVAMAELCTACLAWADAVARLMVTSDIPPDGRVTTIAAAPNLIPLPPAWRDQQEVLELSVSRCEMFANWADDRGRDPFVVDPNVKGLFYEIFHGLWACSARLKDLP